MGKVYIGVTAVGGHKLWGWWAVEDWRQAMGRLRAGHARPLRGGWKGERVLAGNGQAEGSRPLPTMVEG